MINNEACSAVFSLQGYIQSKYMHSFRSNMEVPFRKTKLEVTSLSEVIWTVKYTVYRFIFPIFDHQAHKTERFRTELISSKIKMFLFFILIIGVLKCQSTIDRETLRTKLLDAQNLMQFDQVEFDRLWDFAMSYGYRFTQLQSITSF